eukprot:TRINITY_DN6000_c1_g1_i4.p2 TRINITY_DN6000_c1_g1~~TRINITY_DN6000_c1_g1_i4.p2  ORF type:complete len:107 (-),score=5.06 TRINITY_DN6000_c1_g1_i4:263-538(-)
MKLSINFQVLPLYNRPKGINQLDQLEYGKSSSIQKLNTEKKTLEVIVQSILMSSGQTLGVKAQRFRGHTSPHRNVKEKKKYEQISCYSCQF